LLQSMVANESYSNIIYMVVLYKIMIVCKNMCKFHNDCFLDKNVSH